MPKKAASKKKPLRVNLSPIAEKAISKEQKDIIRKLLKSK